MGTKMENGHPDKCNVLSITRNKTPIKYSCTLHEHQLEHADKAKYLGVMNTSALSAHCK
jgi:hypothetical protein